MTKEEIKKEIEWVDKYLFKLRTTNDPRLIRRRLEILEKRRAAMIEKLDYQT